MSYAKKVTFFREENGKFFFHFSYKAFRKIEFTPNSKWNWNVYKRWNTYGLWKINFSTVV